MSDVQERQELIDIGTLDPERKQQAQAIAERIDISDTQGMVQYGVGAQQKISGFSETILTEIRSKDAGYVGETLSGLVGTIREIDVNSVSGKGGIFSSIKRRIQKFLARYEKLSTQIDTVVANLENARMDLLKDIAMLDSLSEKNEEYLGELDIYIAAGKYKLDQVKETLIPDLEKRAAESGDPMDAQRLQDANQAVNRFEKKLYDMQLSRMIAIQTSPQIRLIQNNNQTLVEKIQSSVLTTIPLWKNQVVIAVSLFRQKKALEIQRQVTDTTNDLLQKNSEMLKQGSLGIARESERGIVEIETLQKVNDDLISTIEETLQIQRDGRTKRREAEVQLQRMEGELKERLSTIDSGGAGAAP